VGYTSTGKMYRPWLKILVLTSSLVLASTALLPIAFTSLESSKTQKIVLFHDPSLDASVELLSVLETLDSVYGTEYEYVFCDVTSKENFEPAKAAGITGAPFIFTQTLDGGISRFPEEFTVESFAKFHTFRTTEITDDKVMRMKDSNGVGDIDGATELLSIAAERPVFIKMYEVRTPP
jgi:hypothetical protein